MLRIKNKKQRYDCEEDHDQEIGARCWSKQFPEDLMRPILQRLCKSDYLSCRVVCLSWRAAVDKAIASKNCPPASRLPWLISLDSRHRFRAKDHHFVNQKFYEPMRVSEKPSGFVSRRRLVGAIEGWLIMVKNLIAVYFLNPITGARVMLPSRSTINHAPFTFKKVVASSVPTRLHHCLVASLSKTFRLAFCKPTDRSWTIIEVEGKAREDELQFVSIENIDEKLYAVTEDLASQSIMVFHISYANGGPPSYTAERLIMHRPRPIRYLFDEIIPHQDEALEFVTYMGDRSPYLTKDSASKELFMIFHRIRVTIGRETTKSVETERFRVFKLECNVKGPRWVEVVDLGDRMLFLSSYGSNFVSSSNGLSCSCDKLERNCIYYAFGFPSTTSDLRRYWNNWMHGSTNISIFGVYSLTNRSVKRPHAMVKHRATSLGFAWFTPNPNPNPW